MLIFNSLYTIFQKGLGHWLHSNPFVFESVFLGSKLAHPSFKSHSCFKTVQKDFDEVYLLSQEIFKAVQNSEILIRPNPFSSFVTNKVFAVSTTDH